MAAAKHSKMRGLWAIGAGVIFCAISYFNPSKSPFIAIGVMFIAIGAALMRTQSNSK